MLGLSDEKGRGGGPVAGSLEMSDYALRPCSDFEGAQCGLFWGDERADSNHADRTVWIWETPATKLAKELGISDVALAKIRWKLNVPEPGVGHWRLVELGRAVDS